MMSKADRFPLLGVVLGIGVAMTIAACASHSHQGSSAAPPTESAEPAVDSANMFSPQHSDIQHLWGEIRDLRREQGLPAEPIYSASESFLRKAPVERLRQCESERHNVPQACQDTCTLKDAICDNAEQICRIADDLGEEDTWAQEKCKSAKASCREATTQCCECIDGTSTGALPPPPGNP